MSNNLVAAKLLVLFAPYVGTFVLEGVKSWVGWIIVALLLSMIFLPVIAIPVISKSKEEQPAHMLEMLMLVEVCLAILYIIFWVVAIVLAFMKY